MPWSYPDNVPPSMKYLKPSIQKKAISISNHILENTNDEGKAIAIGISKAKSVHDKKASLIKLAMINRKPLKDDVVRNRVFNKKMTGKDPESFIDLLKANKGAVKTTDRYKKMVKMIRTRNVKRIVKATGLSAIASAAALTYITKKFGKKKEDEPNKVSD